MEVTKIEIKILSKEFLTASNRVLRAGFEIYDTELDKFVRFLDSNKLISEYIQSCGQPEYDVADEVKEVSQSYGRMIFSLGTTNENEVANIYAVIKYLAENGYGGRSYVYYGYSNSKKYQDKVDSFGDEFIRVLISHIETYLSRITIQMGVGDVTTVHVNIENSTLNNAQLNVANDGSTIIANQTGCDMRRLQELIDGLLQQAETLGDEEKESVQECVEVLSTLSEDKPKKGIINMALKTLQGISGTAQFVAAVTAIAEFAHNIIG